MKFGLNALVGQSGGPTAAINATLCGVIRGCHGKFDTLYGMKNGIEGLIQEELVNLGYLFGDEGELSLLSTTPSAVLGSCRQRLPKDFSDSVYEKIFNLGCKRHAWRRGSRCCFQIHRRCFIIMYQERQHLTRKRQRHLTSADTSTTQQDVVRTTNARRKFRDRWSRHYESDVEVRLLTLTTDTDY